MAAMLVTLGACQNDGHIGWIFGVWRVEEYTVDGVRQEDPLIGKTTLAFQNNVVEVVVIHDEYQTSTELFGSWEKTDKEMTFDFTHGDDRYKPGTGVYAAPWWLGMSSDESMVMAMSNQSGDRFTLTWNTQDGKTNVYKFRKTW